VRWLVARRTLSTRATLPSAYLADRNLLKTEYAKYYGAPLDDPKIAARFDQAAEAASRGSLAGAASVLEGAVKLSALPVVFHDLGVAYASLGDFGRAADAFREVFAREPEYAVSRKFVREVKSIPAGAPEPFTREQEPNNEPSTANLIALRAPVTGEIAGSNDTTDYFKLIAPAAPRDLITIALENHSINFAPRIHVYDADLRLLSWGEKTGRPGESISLGGGPKPNSILYVAITATDGTGGQYLLTVKPESSFDKYEPNDDIMSSRRVAIGEELSANIMDGGDSDFFTIQSPRRGPLTIDIRNRSNTLIPALTMYDANHRNLGFAQEVRKPGSDVRYVLDADKDGVYFIQISSQAGSAGGYSLRVD